MAKAKVVEKEPVQVEETKEKKEEANKEIKGTRYSCTYSPKHILGSKIGKKKIGTTYSPKY